MGFGFEEVNVTNSGQGSTKDLAVTGIKRSNEPFFLKTVLLEKSGDTSELTTLAISVHAVMLESGFVLISPPGSDKLSFSEDLLSVSLRYTLPDLINRKDSKTIESVTVMFQRLDYVVVVYGSLGGCNRTLRVSLDRHRFMPVIDLVMDTLKFEKQLSSGFYDEVFVFWRMVKDGIVFPLLIYLCEKTGLESPPCLMRLPTELKQRMLESLPGESVLNMACVCSEMRYLASDNDLWKQKCLAEIKYFAVKQSGDSDNWKSKFIAFWRQKQRREIGRRFRRPLRGLPTGFDVRQGIRARRRPDRFGPGGNL